jgi:16S rRNA A1518/A1519 N6-dimethyltransferase RsmA/KsgA/DIM1 with predicted DNA glycosylase/AP lyase activity
MRRKKLSTNLESKNLKKTEIESVLESNGFSATARAEELSVEELKHLFDQIGDKI